MYYLTFILIGSTLQFIIIMGYRICLHHCKPNKNYNDVLANDDITFYWVISSWIGVLVTMILFIIVSYTYLKEKRC